MKLWKIWIGIGLFLVGILIPLWLKPQLLGLDQLLTTLSNKTDGNALMTNAFLIVSINTIIAIPQFFSLVMLGDGIAAALKRSEFKTIIPLIIMPIAYVIINKMTPLNYSFGATDIIIWLTIIVMQKLSNQKLNLGMKLLVLSQLIFGVTWLNQVPFLSPYGFGSGSLSMKVKQAAIEIGFSKVLTLYANVLFFIFVVSALILWIYLVLYTEKWVISQDLHRAQLEAQESRSEREVHHLVHDLKTPLSAISGLVSLMELRWSDPKMQEYCHQINRSIDLMNKMITEILYEDRHECCELKELTDYIRATHLSGGRNLSVDFELEGEPQSSLYINKIRVTRAIINLIDNALDAIQGQEKGRVTLRAKVCTNEVILEVEDNGSGILTDDIGKVWKTGYSTKNHPGFGLAFVRQVAEGHGGLLNIKSEVGKGTKVWITLPLGVSQ